MKTETEIAEKKIKSYKEYEKTSFKLVRLASCKSHKASCQRFLEFLGEEAPTPEGALKYEDLKNAIKKYEENGI